MVDEKLDNMLERLRRVDEACDKLDAAHMLVKDVSLDGRLNLPELVYPFGFVRKLAQCRVAAHKERKALKRKARAYEAQQRAARAAKAKLQQEWDDVQANIRKGIARRAVLRKQLYGIDVNTDMEVSND
tara:strand:- start:305 stop:691 length:387 start_codon:yes stop_codon:yes gene_type:complete